MSDKREIKEEKKAQEKPRWQQQLEELRAQKPIQTDILLKEEQDCLVVSVPDEGPIKVFSLVWGEETENIISVHKDGDTSEKLKQLYSITSVGDIIQVRYKLYNDGGYYIFYGNKTKKNAIRDFIKTKLEKEVKADDYKKAVEWMTRNRAVIQNFEMETGQKVFGKY